MHSAIKCCRVPWV